MAAIMYLAAFSNANSSIESDTDFLDNAVGIVQELPIYKSKIFL